MLDDRSYMRSGSESPSRWSATVILMVACTVAFVIQSVVENYTRFPVTSYLALSLYGLEHGYIWQLFTFQFLHGGILHLIFNLITIYCFGHALEDALGAQRMLRLYFCSGVFGGLMQVLGALLLERFEGAVVGASAGAFGLVAAFATLFPERTLQLLVFFVIPLTLRARTLLWISVALAVFGVVIPGDNVAHLAHLGGILTGVIFVRWVVQSDRAALGLWRPFRRQPRPRELVSTRSYNSAPQHRPAVAPEEELAPAEFISREVDPILDKISAHGIHSLTDRERKILEAARKKMSKR